MKQSKSSVSNFLLQEAADKLKVTVVKWQDTVTQQLLPNSRVQACGNQLKTVASVQSGYEVMVHLK